VWKRKKRGPRSNGHGNIEEGLGCRDLIFSLPDASHACCS